MTGLLWAWACGTIVTLIGGTFATLTPDEYYPLKTPTQRAESNRMRKWAARIALTAPLWPIWLAYGAVMLTIVTITDLWHWATDKETDHD